MSNLNFYRQYENKILNKRILVSDFDGTMTQIDFYHYALEKLIPSEIPNYWEEYLTGKLTHFQTMQAYYSKINSSEKELLKALDDLQIDPAIPSSIEALQREGWDVVVVSYGCSWYIKQIFLKSNIDLPVFSNPGELIEGSLQLNEDKSSEFYDQNTGVSKKLVIQKALSKYKQVAFAGDGQPDYEPALLVEENLRFAKNALAQELEKNNKKFKSFQKWSEIAEELINNYKD